GHGFVFPAASTLVSRGADPDQHGVVTGLFYAVLVSGVAVVAPVMAAVASVTTFGGGIWASAWVSLISLAFLARVLISTETPLVVGSTRLMNGPKEGESPRSSRRLRGKITGPIIRVLFNG